LGGSREVENERKARYLGRERVALLRPSQAELAVLKRLREETGKLQQVIVAVPQ
jgi:hypothetical protein